MRSRSRWLVAVGVGSLAASTAGFALNCAPSEDLSVTVITNCDPTKLNLADPAEATVKAYMDNAPVLRDRGKAVVEAIRVACNNINKDVGDPEGADIRAACNPIGKRIVAAAAQAPIPTSGLRANWATVVFDATTCDLDEKAEAACLDTCSGKAGCDSVATCEPNKLEGTCAGDCTGLCSVTGTDVPCNGQCNGECTSPEAGVEAGIPGCAGECRGFCSTPTWLGNCAAGCNAGFRGQCAGTCTGSCDGVPFPPNPSDGGMMGEGGMGEGGMGDGGVAEGGGEGGPGDASADAAEAGPPPGSGNCLGLCTGKCTGGTASGSCTAKCNGAFSGGACAGVGACVGVCTTSPGVGCTTQCNGTCEQNSAACAGTCNGCSTPIQNGACTGNFNCGDINPICKGVCTTKGAMAATCGSVPMDIRIAGDYKLALALKAHAPELTAALREAAIINSNLGGVDQTAGKFRAIGVVNDNARICADGTTPIYDEARSLFSTAVHAQGVLSGVNF